MRTVEIKDGDAEGTLAYLCGKAKADPSFFFINSTSIKKVD